MLGKWRSNRVEHRLWGRGGNGIGEVKGARAGVGMEVGVGVGV